MYHIRKSYVKHIYDNLDDYDNLLSFDDRLDIIEYILFNKNIEDKKVQIKKNIENKIYKNDYSVLKKTINDDELIDFISVDKLEDGKSVSDRQDYADIATTLKDLKNVIIFKHDKERFIKFIDGSVLASEKKHKRHCENNIC